MTPRTIAEIRMRRQRLWGEPLTSAAEVVGWLVAVQAQDFFGSKWSVAQRMARAPAAGVPATTARTAGTATTAGTAITTGTASPVTEAELDAAFDAGEILRTHLLRPTWHFVTPADIRGLLALTAPRVHAVNAGAYRRIGVDGPVLAVLEKVLLTALTAGPQTRPALQQAISNAGIDLSVPTRLSTLLMHAELDGLICSGPRIGNQFSYRLLDDVVPAPASIDLDAVAVDLALRYLRSRGPATAHDLAAWSGLTVTSCRTALAHARPAVRESVVDGVAYWDAVEPAIERPDRPRASLLSVFDEYLAGYRDRYGTAAPETAARLRAMGNELTGVVALDSQLIGSWKRRSAGTSLAVDVRLFVDLDEDARASVQAATHRLARYVGREVTDG